MKLLLSVLVLFTSAVFASENPENAYELKYFSYFIALGLTALGGTLGQSRAVSVALEGIGRNPNAKDKIQTPMILGLAFMESLVLFVIFSTKFI